MVSAEYGRWWSCSYFEEEFLPVEQVGDEHPQRRPPQALEEPLPVTVQETHLPTEREVEAQQGVSDVHQDGVRPWVYKRPPAPPAFNVNDKVHASQQQEGEKAHARHIGQRPKVFIDRYKSSISCALSKDGCRDSQKDCPH